jgi:protein-disulfide isomerase
MRRILLVLFALTSALPATAQSFSPEQTKAIEEMVRAYILKNPEIIREAVEALQAKEQQSADERRMATAAQLKDQLLNDPAAPVLGNPAGDVTLVEFFDYRCPYCKKAAPVVEQLLKEDGKIRRVMKEFPILGPESVFASRAALAAKMQDRYEPFHKAMIGAKGALDQDMVFRLAKEAGVDVARMKRDMNAPEVEDALRRNRELASALEITGTPAFIIGNDFVPGAAELETFKTLVARARKG